MPDHNQLRADIDRRQRAVEQALRDLIRSGGRLAIVQAPPGSGKTHTLIHAVAFARQQRLRVAVAPQTNAQADDICRRLTAADPSIRIWRFLASGAEPVALGDRVSPCHTSKELPHGPCVVVAPTAKWGVSNIVEPFDVLFVDEAWQMSFAEFMLCSQVAGRFVLIGDPGQIPPVVSIDVARWETSERAPHIAAPQVILEQPELAGQGMRLELPASRRLPADSVELVQAFYDFRFDAWAGPGERAILADRGRSHGVDRAVELLQTGSVCILTIPTPDNGPPLERDDEIAKVAAGLAVRLLDLRARFRMGGDIRPIRPEDIGLAATHRVMNTALRLALPEPLRDRVTVDTPERWQGLQRPVMVVVHPLSGVVRPSSFDLETGRLCVMASRHQGGLVLVGRDHIASSLDQLIPSADQPIGRPDIAGRGHAVHLHLWSTLAAQGRVVAA